MEEYGYENYLYQSTKVYQGNFKDFQAKIKCLIGRTKRKNTLIS